MASLLFAPWVLCFPGLSAAAAESRSQPALQHWAFQAPVLPAPPKVRNQRWVRNPIDAFVLQRLEQERITPSPEADRRTLLRRVHLDLIGLPPSPADVAAFVADPDPKAYERRVDQLLASPHFGERWGRHWLDLARYADTSGYQIDRPRPSAYLYRDWVLWACNQDLPYDQFTLQQLAGDLLPGAGTNELAASGFHRMTLSNHEEGVDPEEFRCKAKVDRVSTTGGVWLGLTVGCAECHNHKYDPITQREFYQLYAFFNNADEVEGPAMTLLESTNVPAAHVHVRGDFLRHGEQVRPGTPAVFPPLRARGAHADRLDLARWIVASENPLASRVAVNQVWLHLFGRGLVNTPEDFGTRGEPPSHPELLDWLACVFAAAPATRSASCPPGRAASAGPAPGEVPALGWSRKGLIRLILLSATYRQSSCARPELNGRDPMNVWLARQNRVRVESEILRDLSLSAGGLLNPAIGGPSFHPFLPDDLKRMGSAGAFTWVDSIGPELHRRGLYIFAQRTVPYPTSMTFDQADPTQSCARRDRSNTPLQALTLLNNEVFLECSQGLAARLQQLPEGSARARIGHGFELCVARPPSPAELSRLERLLEQGIAAACRPPRASPAGVAESANGESDSARAAGWVALSQVLLNLDEFMTRE